MSIDALQRIELLSPADYVDALKRIEPTERPIGDVVRPSGSPGSHSYSPPSCTCTRLCQLERCESSLRKVCQELCGEMNVAPATNLAVLVEFFKSPSSEYELRLRPSVIGALHELGIAGRGSWSFQEELSTEEQLVEGASFTVQVSAFERNPVARRKCIAHYGLSCTVCRFNFENAYGSSAEGYAHVHHLMPLASIGEEYVIDPIEDLRQFVPTVMLSSLTSASYSIEEMKVMLHGGGNI
jgi:hypothetical protein